MRSVFRFWFNPDNLRESHLIEVINERISHGYLLRQILTESLLNYRETKNNTKGWDHLYDQLSALLGNLESGGLEEQQEKNDTILSPFFLDALKKSAKIGINLK